MSRVPQIWTNTDKEGKGTTLLPIVSAEGHLIVDADIDMATEGIATAENQMNIVSTKNSTSTPLLAGATWTGEWEDVSAHDYVQIVAAVSDSKLSADNGFIIQWSADSVEVANETLLSVQGGDGATSLVNRYEKDVRYKYLKVSYTNGTEDQVRFNLLTVFRKGFVFSDIERALTEPGTADTIAANIATIAANSAGGADGTVGITDGNATRINPATEDTLAKTVGFDVNADITTDISTPNLIIETDGVRTLTTTITATEITEVWS